jgi:glyoxylase I family protein
MGFPRINGLGHLDLTVTDGDRSVRWSEQVLGFTHVSSRDMPHFKLRSVVHPTASRSAS